MYNNIGVSFHETVPLRKAWLSRWMCLSGLIGTTIMVELRKIRPTLVQSYVMPKGNLKPLLNLECDTISKEICSVSLIIIEIWDFLHSRYVSIIFLYKILQIMVTFQVEKKIKHHKTLGQYLSVSILLNPLISCRTSPFSPLDYFSNFKFYIWIWIFFQMTGHLLTVQLSPLWQEMDWLSLKGRNFVLFNVLTILHFCIQPLLIYFCSIP